MYSARRVSERISTAQREYSLDLAYHTPDEVSLFESYLTSSGKYVYDEMGHSIGTQSLSDFDRQWMLNEQLLVQCDAAYFLTRYAYLIDEDGVVVRFIFRVAQKILFDIISDLEERGASIEIMCLKARQLGVTSLIQLLIAHRIIFGYGANAVSGSADRQKTGLMASKLFMAYDMLPIWLAPRATRRVESDQGMLVFGQSLSGVSFQHGAQMSGIARGTTPTIYHLSEVASFQDAKSQIEASLFKCVHASEKVFGILESTGEGDKGWWPDTWRHAKENWQHGRSRLCPVFLPWFCGIGMYPKPTDLITHPIPNGWKPNHDTREHVAMCELYVRSHPLLPKHLGNGWRMPVEQQWYWEVFHEEHKAKGLEATWFQEMAGNDEEALQRSAQSVFGHATTDAIARSREKSYQCYSIVGQSIEDRHVATPEYIDYSSERIPLRFTSIKGQSYKWELIPLKIDPPLRDNDPDDAAGVFVVFHPPLSGHNYSIGVDTSEGKGEDSTAISVWDIGGRDAPDIQVAEFSSPYINHVEAFAFVMAVATYYSKHMSWGVTRWPAPYVAIEQVAAVGDTCQLQMAKMGYPGGCFHKMVRYDSKKVDKSKSNKMGWFTYPWSRPILMTNFVHAAQSGWLRINSPWLIYDMKHFEVHITSTGKERLEHEEGEHDDRIFAAAMASFCPHDLDVLADRSKNRPVDAEASLPNLDVSPYGGRSIPYEMLKEKQPVNLDDILYSDPRGRR